MPKWVRVYHRKHRGETDIPEKCLHSYERRGWRLLDQKKEPVRLNKAAEPDNKES